MSPVTLTACTPSYRSLGAARLKGLLPESARPTHSQRHLDLQRNSIALCWVHNATAARYEATPAEAGAYLHGALLLGHPGEGRGPGS